MSDRSDRKPYFPKEGHKVVALQLSEKDRESLEVLKRLLGCSTSSAAIRSAINRTRFLLEMTQQGGREVALVDHDGKNPVIVHIVG